MNIKGKKIGIWGYGKEGKSVEKKLLEIGGFKELSILLDKLDPLEMPANSDRSIYVGEHASELIRTGYFDLIFKSPGVSLYRDEIPDAKRSGTKFSSGTNLWFENASSTKTIIITGTKGKSTTSSLLYHVLKGLGKSVSLAGNIGTPLLDLDVETDYCIVELSSYQLADLEHSADLCLITNLFPEHLDWHITHDNYYHDKLQFLNKMKNKTVIANAKNSKLCDMLSKFPCDVTWFNDESNDHVASGLKGEHNQENIQGVLKTVSALGLDSSDAENLVLEFEPLAHRMEEFKGSNNLLCIDDSISTTPESCIAAIDVYKDYPLIIILGGSERGQNYETLMKRIDEISPKAVLLLPETGKRIFNEFSSVKRNYPIVEFEDMSELAQWIYKNGTDGDAVLLSPAAPSYGTFTNYIERGKLFKTLMTQ